MMKSVKMRLVWRAWVGACAVVAGLDLSYRPVNGQIQAINPQVRPSRGQGVVPVFEGWFVAADGTTHASFGYFNRNTDQVIDVPVGASNSVGPGPADQGQPTRFFPGRQYGVFTVKVPREKPDVDLSWTLAVNGHTTSIPVNLDPLFVIDPLKERGGSYPGNTPPAVKFGPAESSTRGPAGITVARTATVSTPLPLEVWVADDGLPPPPKPADGADAGGAARRGLSVVWSVFRGPGSVAFSRATPPVEQGRASATATFVEPGEYLLRVLVSDGSAFSAQCCWTNGYVRVTVGRGGPGR